MPAERHLRDADRWGSMQAPTRKCDGQVFLARRHSNADGDGGGEARARRRRRRCRGAQALASGGTSAAARRSVAAWPLPSHSLTPGTPLTPSHLRSSPGYSKHAKFVYAIVRESGNRPSGCLPWRHHSLLHCKEPRGAHPTYASMYAVQGLLIRPTTVQAAANGAVQTPASAFLNASGTMIVSEVAGSPVLARMAAADTVVIGRNASESSDYLAALRAGAPEDDRGWEPTLMSLPCLKKCTCHLTGLCMAVKVSTVSGVPAHLTCLGTGQGRAQTATYCGWCRRLPLSNGRLALRHQPSELLSACIPCLAGTSKH